MFRFKTLALAAVAAATLSVAAAPQAEARGRGVGFGALAAGLIVGGAAAAIASQAYAGPDYTYCYNTRQWVETPYGPVRRTVRVCE